MRHKIAGLFLISFLALFANQLYAQCTVSFYWTTSGMTANFVNNTVGATSYQWDFGDGSSSFATNPTHTYSTPGYYVVCLTAFDFIGAPCGTQCYTLALNGPCTSVPGVSTSGLTANFTNSSSGAFSYQWYFGDGTTSTLAAPSHTYASSGTYYACLYGFDSLGLFCDSSCVLVNVSGSGPCNAAFTSTPFSGSNAVQFNNNSTGASTYQWFFGNGSTSTASNPTYTYGSPGFYTVCLYAFDSAGAFCDSTCQVISVGSAPCNAAFTLGTSGMTATFLNNSSGFASHQWYFGDGSTSTNFNATHTYSAPGTYYACLVLYDSLGNWCDSTCQNVTITGSGPCNASFTATPISSTSAVVFSNTSTGASSFQWYFGDGSTSTTFSPTYTYSSPGVYYACLYAFDSAGAFCDSTCMAITVGTVPCNAGFTHTTTGLTATFFNNSTGGASYQWYFGDGSTATTYNASHSYSSPGTYYACLVLYDSLGNWCDSTCAYVTVSSGGGGPCSASFTGTPISSTTAVMFSNTSTGATSFQWYFGNGGTSTVTSPTYTYSTPGVYTVCLYAFDSAGAFCDSTCQVITVSANACNSAFSFTTSGLTANFINNATGGSSYQWYFGDGTTSFGVNATHTYPASGTYWACLYVFDTLGNFCDSTCQQVNVTGGGGGCNAAFTATPISGTTAVIFTNNSTGATSYQWYFGNGGTSTNPNPTYTYSSPGTYTVCLYAFDSAGAFCDSTCQVVNVFPTGCNAQFTHTTSGLTANFSNSSSGYVTYQWYFGDGSTSTLLNPNHTYASTGTYYACLVLYDSLGNWCDSTCQFVNVTGGGGGPCSAAFTANPISGTTAVIFNNNSTGATSFQWYFGNGGTSTNPNPTYTYSSPGTYTVCLYAFDSAGAFCDSTCMTLTILGSGCNAAFSHTTSGLTANFSNSSTGYASYQWYFGDGNTSTTFNPTHTYAATGTYYACLVLYDSLGNWCDSTCQFVNVTGGSTGCSVSFGAASSGLTAFFSNTSSGATSYQWTFGDGNTSTSANPAHTYATSGVYTVCLYGFNSAGGLCDSVCQAVTVIAPPCTASFNIGSISGTTVSLVNTSGASGYQWYFGDGNTSTATNPTHTYASPGVYYICLYAFDSAGAFCDSTCRAVTIVTPGACNAAFTAVPISGTTAVLFNNNSTGSNTFLWFFGDGNSSTFTNPTHTYFSPGVYTVCLYAYDSSGTFCDSTCQVITVGSPASCTAGFSTASSGLSVNFTDFSTSTSSIISWYWVFGDGTTSTVQNPAHTYAASGTYTTCLYITTADSCSDSHCAPVIVNGSTTGLTTQPSFEGWQVWPNPADNYVNIQFTAPENGRAQISIVNLLGVNVGGAEVTARAGDTVTEQLPVNELPAGVYLVQVRMNDMTKTQKLLID